MAKLNFVRLLSDSILTSVIMLRTGRFKHRMIDEFSLPKLAESVYLKMQPWVKAHELKQISAAELCTVVIEIYQETLREKNWLCPQPRTHIHLATESEIINRANTSLYRGVPLSVNRSLVLWHLGKYPLELLFYIPTPEEVFHMQCEGKRCMTLFKEIDEISRLTQIGRDPFGFLLHDLIHADHFFRNPQLAQGQIGFSKLIAKSIKANCFTEHTSDEIFKKDFEYLISDMNSHPVHLVKTLRAILLSTTKRALAYNPTDFLSSKDENRFQSKWRDILSTWGLDGTFCTSFERVNNTDFSFTEDAQQIFQFCLAEGAQTSAKFFANIEYL